MVCCAVWFLVHSLSVLALGMDSVGRTSAKRLPSLAGTHRGATPSAIDTSHRPDPNKHQPTTTSPRPRDVTDPHTPASHPADTPPNRPEFFNLNDVNDEGYGASDHPCKRKFATKNPSVVMSDRDRAASLLVSFKAGSRSPEPTPNDATHSEDDVISPAKPAANLVPPPIQAVQDAKAINLYVESTQRVVNAGIRRILSPGPLLPAVRQKKAHALTYIHDTHETLKQAQQRLNKSGPRGGPEFCSAMRALRKIADVQCFSASREIYTWGIQDALEYAKFLAREVKPGQPFAGARVVKETLDEALIVLNKVQALVDRVLPVEACIDELNEKINFMMSYDTGDNFVSMVFASAPADSVDLHHSKFHHIAMLNIGYAVARTWSSALRATVIEFYTNQHLEGAQPGCLISKGTAEDARNWAQHAVRIAHEQTKHAVDVWKDWNGNRKNACGNQIWAVRMNRANFALQKSREVQDK